MSRCRSSASTGYRRALTSGRKSSRRRLIEDSSIPHSIVRATHFFEFIKAIADAATDGNAVRLPPALIQPIAADDVASARARVSVGAPLNRTVEIAGPDQFPLDVLVRGVLTMRNDPGEVITDPRARYWGISPTQQTLLPGADAHLSTTHFGDWLRYATAETPRDDFHRIMEVSHT